MMPVAAPEGAVPVLPSFLPDGKCCSSAVKGDPEGQLGSVTLDFPFPTFSWTQQNSAKRGAPCGSPKAWQPWVWNSQE